MINPSTTLATIASLRPALTGELERLGPDDCCGGQRSLAAACAERGLDAEAITATHLHVHKENNPLFPAVLAQEQRLAA